MIQDIAPHKFNNAYRPDAAPRPSDPVFHFRGRDVAVRDAGEELSLPEAAICPEGGHFRYLFAIDKTPYFLYESDADLTLSGDDLQYVSVREARRSTRMPRALSFAVYTALQLAQWYRDNRFCGTCGSRTGIGSTERSIVCPACGRTIYPRIVPAVIVGVIRGDELLHTKYVRARGISFYALVAGFTEIGETLEETVAREVMEETGLRVKHIRYFKSQPWGVADDILAGFYCDVDGDGEIRIDTSELSEAVWIKRKDIVGQPDDASLTNHMMITFREGKEPPYVPPAP